MPIVHLKKCAVGQSVSWTMVLLTIPTGTGGSMVSRATTEEKLAVLLSIFMQFCALSR